MAGWYGPSPLVEWLEDGLVAHKGKEDAIDLARSGDNSDTFVLTTRFEARPVIIEVGLPLRQAMGNLDEGTTEVGVTHFGDAPVFTTSLVGPGIVATADQA